MGMFNLLDQLTFYGAYHNNKWNKLIHVIFVPTILWTICVWLATTGVVFGPGQFGELQITKDISLPLVANLPLLLMSAYTLFYLCLDPFAGLTWALFTAAPMWLTATAFAATQPKAALIAVPIHVLSWYMQIHPGHAVLEKRKPALMDSLVQAFAQAPLFVWLEILFYLGYRQELHKELETRVSQAVAAHRRSLRKKTKAA